MSEAMSQTPPKTRSRREGTVGLVERDGVITCPGEHKDLCRVGDGRDNAIGQRLHALHESAPSKQVAAGAGDRLVRRRAVYVITL